MTRTGLVFTTLAGLSLGAAPAFAQDNNKGKPAAPAPSKAAPMETGGKPKPEGGGAMTKKGGGAMMKKSGGMMKKKHK